jgi:transcriptional regulator with GAF, ATPase, and Fis domain
MNQNLALDLWRTVGRHDGLQQALQAALAVVRPHLTVRRAAIRFLVAEHRQWETVAVIGDGEAATWAGVDRLADAGEPALPDVLRREGFVCADASRFALEHPGVVPHAARGPLLLAAMADEPRLSGVLLLAGPGLQAPTPAAREGVLALVEPLGAALRHFARQRDAAALREAAEADRRSLLARLGRSDIAEVVVGAGTGLRDVMERVAQVARADAPVLLLGETGSGKEVVAREIHRHSARALGPFVRVNCGAIPAELVDSELFGHERGSFTGAVAQRRGWFERADGGTLFLDEVAELPLQAQVRLLRVLQDGLVLRVGGEQPIAVSARVVAATHQDLRAMTRDGRFREDLWYRLAVFPIVLPSLRERVGDVPALATHFAQRAAVKLGLTPCLPDDEGMRLLCSYDWPGNIRELSSVIERAAILGNGRRLEVAKALGAVTVSASAPGPARRPSTPVGGTAAETQAFATFDAQARQHVEAALRRCLGRVDGPFGAAALLGVNPQTLRSRMRRLGVDARPFRALRGRDLPTA